MNKDELQKLIHELDEQIRVCVKCPLHESRTRAVPGEGPVPADVLVLGEAPGASEDHLGRPFVGPSGRLLTGPLETVAAFRVPEAVDSMKQDMLTLRQLLVRT